MNKHILYFFIILLCFNSCTLLQKTRNFLKDSNNAKENTNLIFSNFKNAVESIVSEISNDKTLFFCKKISLYINILKNESNIFLENQKLTNVIQVQILKKIKKFNVIDIDQINKTKKELGLSEDNKFLNTNTVILLARNNNATYYLDSSIINCHHLLLLDIKLILVKTGEIIFHKKKNFYFL